MVIFFISSSAFAEGSRIAVVIDGPAPELVAAVGSIAAEVNAVDGAGTMPETATHTGDFTRAKAAELFDAAFADPDVKLIVALGTVVGMEVAEREKLAKPVILPYAAPLFLGLARKGEGSGRPNLSYVSGLLTIGRDMARFHDIVQREEVVALVDEYIVNALPALRTQPVWQFGKVTARLIPVPPSVDATLAAIPEDARAVYFGPLLRFSPEDVVKLIEGVNARGLPSYASGGNGRRWVELGALTTLEPADDIIRRHRQVALYVTDALRGAKVEEFSTVFEPRAQLAINIATAREIGVSPSFEVLTEAEQIGGDAMRASGESLTIGNAVLQALGENTDLQASRTSVKVTAAQLSQARSAVLPTLAATAGWTWLDPDVASSFGNAEHTGSWGLTAQQLLYSPSVPAAIRASRAALQASGAGLQREELDLVFDTVTAFLNVLRASNAGRIHQENLKSTRAHLSLAEVRVEIGSAGRQEILRWQAQIADDRAKVIQASATRNLAEIELNRLLARPLENEVGAVEPELIDLGVVPAMQRFVQDPWSFRILRKFMVDEAIGNSPDVRELDAAIELQSAVRNGQKQQLFIPNVALVGGVTHTFLREGEGSEDPPPASGFLPPDDFVWQVGLNLQIELFNYTRYGALDETRAAIVELEQRRKSLQERIEQGMRSALHQAGASSATMRLSAVSAEAAAKNLELVADGYRTGSLGILNLIDAQNQARVARLAASDARYDFLLDVVRVERAGGRFSMLATDAERTEFIQRLTEFMKTEQGQAQSENQ